MMTKSRNLLIDIFKLFFAICILFIHVTLSNFIPKGEYIKQIIFRLGIPFFFITSGYYYSKRKKGETIDKKILVQYFFWGVIYLLFNYFIYFNNNYNYLFEDMQRLLTGNVLNIIWYTGTMIWSFIILSRINDKKWLIISMIVAFLLYLIGLSFTSYYNIIPNKYTPILNSLISVFKQNRSFWFSGYLFVSLGYYIGKYVDIKKIDKIYIIIPFLISINAVIIETNYIIKNNTSFCGEHDFMISHILFATLFLMLLLKINIKGNSKYIRNLSSGIYYLHFLIIFIIKIITKNNSIRLLDSGHIYYCFIVLALTIITTVIMLKSKKLGYLIS